MKDSKYCKYSACCWNHRHELLGLVLIVIATLLTVTTNNSIGIAAMFLVGLGLCCGRHLSCHMGHSKDHCHSGDESCCTMPCENNDKEPAKKTTKAKK